MYLRLNRLICNEPQSFDFSRSLSNVQFFFSVKRPIFGILACFALFWHDM